MNLLIHRNRVGLSQKDIAELIGVSQSYYSQVESGNRNPSYSFLKKFRIVFPKTEIGEVFFNQ